MLGAILVDIFIHNLEGSEEEEEGSEQKSVGNASFFWVFRCYPKERNSERTHKTEWVGKPMVEEL